MRAGTSMATPGAASSALLVRQYFIDTNQTFWRAKCKTSYRSCKSFSPSGMLTKAILLHSGRPMSLFDCGAASVSLGAPPDNIQGFGRISLSNVLPLKAAKTNFDLFVADAVNIGENSNINYLVTLARPTQISTPLK